MNLRAGLPLLGLPLAACGGAEAGAGAHVTVTDSAGVVVVTNGRGALEAAARRELVPEPSLRIMSREEAELILFDVAAATPLEGGRLAVINGGSQEVLVLGRDGEILRRLGGAGDGPGEFRQAQVVLPLGDSLGVYDASRRRLSVFGPSGALVREVDFGGLAEAGAFVTLLPLARGELVLVSRGGFRPEPGVYRTETEWFRVSTTGEVRASYGRLPGNELAVFPGGMGALLFGAATWAATVRDDLVVGTGEAPEVRFYSPDGALARIARWPDHERAVTPEHVQRFLAAGLAEAPEEQHASLRDGLGVESVRAYRVVTAETR